MDPPSRPAHLPLSQIVIEIPLRRTTGTAHEGREGWAVLRARPGKEDREYRPQLREDLLRFRQNHHNNGNSSHERKEEWNDHDQQGGSSIGGCAAPGGHPRCPARLELWNPDPMADFLAVVVVHRTSDTTDARVRNPAALVTAGPGRTCVHNKTTR